MNNILENSIKALYHNVIVHIYSSPNFIMETCISLLMCVIHYLLISEINGVIKDVNMPLLKIRVKQSLEDVKSGRSVYKGVVRNHPDLDLDVVFKEKSFIKNHWDTTTKINKILSTSLSEYIRRDSRGAPQKSSNESENGENAEEDKVQPSVEKIYECLIREPQMKKPSPDYLQKVERTEVIRLS